MVTVLYSTTNASLTDWGSVHEGRIVKGQLEHKPPMIADKFPGAFSGVPVPEMLSFVPEGPLRPDGQYHDGGVHQLSGGPFD